MSQSAYILRPAETQSPYVTFPVDVGGSGAATWALVGPDAWEGGTVVDNSGYVNTFAIDDDGELQMVPLVGAATIRIGYQHDMPMVTAPLADIFPDFDYTDDTVSLELLWHVTSMPASTAKWGQSIGIMDSAPASVASCVGAFANAYPNSATVWNIGVSSATGLQTNASMGTTIPEWVWARFTVNPSTREIAISGRVTNASGTVQQVTTFTGGVAAMSATVANWRVAVRFLHVAAVGGTQLQAGRLYARMVRSDDFPVVTPGSKAAAGQTLIVLLIGDSIGDGIGNDPTGDGSDELAYGGASMISGCRLLHSNGAAWANQATYPDNAGAAPENPGLVPHIHRRAIELGYAGCDVYRYAVSGASTPTVKGFFEESATLLLPLGVRPHLVAVVSGTNDSNNSTESDAFEAMIGGFLNQIQRKYPSSRVGWVEPIAATGAKAQADVVRASIQTHIAAGERMYSVAGAGLTAADTIHPTLATYSTQGEGIVDGYVAVG